MSSYHPIRSRAVARSDLIGMYWMLRKSVVVEFRPGVRYSPAMWSYTDEVTIGIFSYKYFWLEYVRRAPALSKDELVAAQEHVDVLKRFDSVACGDVVLMVETVGAITCSPDARV